MSFFPAWFSSVLEKEKAWVYGPSGKTYAVDLNPETVHTIVLWSKNYSNLIENKKNIRDLLKKYNQLYLHFTITGLGGTRIERGVPSLSTSLRQLDPIVEITEKPERVTLRFDPCFFWEEKGKVLSNLSFFKKLAAEISARGIKNVRFSFAQWYGKAKRRADKLDFPYVDPPLEKKLNFSRDLVEIAQHWNLNLYSCSQGFLTSVPGIHPSSCINGPLLEKLHPASTPVSSRKDRSQRAECGCTESIDIGSYSQTCPHCCLYCYANPTI